MDKDKTPVRQKPTMQPEPLESQGQFAEGKIMGTKWKIIKKLDEGGFGSVYKVQHIKFPDRLAALKVEPSEADEENHLKQETHLLKAIHGSDRKPHVPLLLRSGKKKAYCYIIMSLLGDNLRKLKDKYFPKGMALRTWSRIGVQCLYAIKIMHDRGYVHRDIKAQNFVLGYAATPAYARVVHIIDFGLARCFAFPHGSPVRKWTARKARPKLEFRGTFKYASPSMHEEKEQGRKDDIWSFLYMMMDLYCGLPWQDAETRKVVETKKLYMKDKDLMVKMPEETKFIPTHLRTLDVYQRPDYFRIYQAFHKLLKKCKVSYDSSYEWESPAAAKANQQAMKERKAPVGYTEADEFFKSDPLMISRAPTLADEKSLADNQKRVKPEALSVMDLLELSSKSKTIDKTETISVINSLQPTKPVELVSVTPEAATPVHAPTTDKPKTPDVMSPPASTKSNGRKRDRTDDSADFIPSCYLNIDIPLQYLKPEEKTKYELQKEVTKIDWGHMKNCEDKPKNCSATVQSPVKKDKDGSGKKNSCRSISFLDFQR